MTADLWDTTFTSLAQRTGRTTTRQITAEEWRAIVRADAELTLASEAGIGPHFARWSGPSRHAEPWLDWSAGNVYTKNPDSAYLAGG